MPRAADPLPENPFGSTGRAASIDRPTAYDHPAKRGAALMGNRFRESPTDSPRGTLGRTSRLPDGEPVRTLRPATQQARSLLVARRRGSSCLSPSALADSFKIARFTWRDQLDNSRKTWFFLGKCGGKPRKTLGNTRG